jgi:hypothetical protein
MRTHNQSQTQVSPIICYNPPGSRTEAFFLNQSIITWSALPPLFKSIYKVREVKNF